MGCDSIFSGKVYWSGFELGFHDTEAFFDFSMFWVYFNDTYWLVNIGMNIPSNKEYFKISTKTM